MLCKNLLFWELHETNAGVGEVEVTADGHDPTFDLDEVVGAQWRGTVHGEHEVGVFDHRRALCRVEEGLVFTETIFQRLSWYRLDVCFKKTFDVFFFFTFYE